MKSKKHNGFTMFELLITLGIVGILSVIALPNMSSFMKNNRLTTQINSLLSYLQYARSEAILRHKQIIICASSDEVSCSGGWSDGWIVFNDDDQSGDLSGTETILKVHEKLQGETVLSSSGPSTIIFDRRGFTPDSAGTFSLCDDRGVDDAKSISISNTGRIRNGGVVTC